MATECETVTHLERLRFNLGYYLGRKPVLVKGGARRWIDAEHFELETIGARFADRRVRVAYNEQGKFDYNEGSGPVQHQEMTFGQAVELFRTAPAGNYYMAQKTFHRLFPELVAHVGHPPLLDFTKHVAATNIWIGGARCKTPLHFDYSDNLFAQVSGRKRMSLFAPEQSKRLYPAIGRVDEHCSMVDIFAPDLDKFPLFAEAKEHEVTVEVEAGDLLYIPVRWWHAVEAVTPSVALNFWWFRMTQQVVDNGRLLFSAKGRKKIMESLRR